MHVPILIHDTHRLIPHLQSKGFDKTQAEGITDAILEIDSSQIATKQDIKDLYVRIEQVESRITLRLGSLIAGGVAFLAFLKFFG